MAMVTITRNGKNYLRVSKGAYNEMYRKQGFRIAGTDEIKENEAKMNEDTIYNNETNGEHPQEDPGEQVNNPEIPEEEEDNGEEEKSLEEKTFKEMSLEELQEYAKINGIDVEGLTEKKEIRKAIKAALNN